MLAPLTCIPTSILTVISAPRLRLHLFFLAARPGSRPRLLQPRPLEMESPPDADADAATSTSTFCHPHRCPHRRRANTTELVLP